MGHSLLSNLEGNLLLLNTFKTANGQSQESERSNKVSDVRLERNKRNIDGLFRSDCIVAKYGKQTCMMLILLKG